MTPYNVQFSIDRIGVEIKKAYALKGRIPGDDPGYADWPGRIWYDICAGMAPEASLSKHLYGPGELYDSLGLPKPIPAVPSAAPFRGAFCIPNASPGIPFGDGQRDWTPAFGCYAGTGWQERMIKNQLDRHYTWFEYQISGKPYRDDYPTLAVDVARIVADLTKLKQAGLATIVAFDDTRLDLSYLQPVADATQDLVDCVMGIYELNGVVNWNEDEVIRILKAQHDLWPRAVNAFHSTTQDNGGRGFGERPFWERAVAEAHVDVYFLQQSGWNHSVNDCADRAHDFHIRLMQNPDRPDVKPGWVTLPRGMVHFELSTSVIYRGWTEAQGVQLMDQVLAAIKQKSGYAMAGFMDSGTP